MVLHKMQTSSKRGQLQHYDHSLWYSCTSEVTGNLPSGRTWSSAPGCSLWKEKWPDVWLYSSAGAMTYGLLGDQGHWRHITRKLKTRKFVEEVCKHLSKWAKIMKIFVSHKNCHQRVTSAEKDWKNQVDGMSYFWTIVSFFLQTFLSLSSGFMNKMMECPGRKSCMCSHHGLHLLRPPCLLSHCWVLSQPGTEITLSLLRIIIYWNDQLSTWWQVDYIGIFPL